MNPRRNPNATEKIAALLIIVLGIPRETAKTMTARQICQLVQWDHYPVAYNTARDLGWDSDAVNHPTNLQPPLVADHLEKSAKIDTPTAAKGKRLTRAHAEFRSRILQPAEPSTKPPSRLRGRGFRGHRRMDGTIVWKDKR